MYKSSTFNGIIIQIDIYDVQLMSCLLFLLLLIKLITINFY